MLVRAAVVVALAFAAKKFALARVAFTKVSEY